jgi:hypothetical protein
MSPHRNNFRLLHVGHSLEVSAGLERLHVSDLKNLPNSELQRLPSSEPERLPSSEKQFLPLNVVSNLLNGNQRFGGANFLHL